MAPAGGRAAAGAGHGLRADRVLLLAPSLARHGPRPGFAAGEAAAGMIVFGILPSVVAFAATRGATPWPVEVRHAGRELAAIAPAPDPLTAAAYAIVVVSPIGLMFGVLWSRTRSLALVVLLHGGPTSCPTSRTSCARGPHARTGPRLPPAP